MCERTWLHYRSFTPANSIIHLFFIYGAVVLSFFRTSHFFLRSSPIYFLSQKWRESLTSNNNSQEEWKDGRPSKPDEEISRSQSQSSFYEYRRGNSVGEENFLAIDTGGSETLKDNVRWSPSRRLSASLNETLKRRGASQIESSQESRIGSREPTKRLSSSFKVVDSCLEVTDDALNSVFYTFCVYGKRSGPPDLLDGRQFAKMMKDAKIMNKKFNTTAVDILFSKVLIDVRCG